MPIYLASNVGSLAAQRHLNTTSNSLNKSLERLSSGSKINHASDGAGSLLASENLRSQIRGSDIAMSNAQQGLSLVQTADGALSQIADHLQAMRDIAVAASNGTNTASTWASYQADYNSHQLAITAIATAAEFNNNKLIDGTAAAMTLQVGPNSADTITIGAAAFGTNTAAGLAVNTTTITDTATATARLGNVDAALATLTTNLAATGNYESQLQGVMDNLAVAKENYTSAESSLRNTDVAAETANVTRLQILQQAAAYALAQANSQPSIALKLLQ